MPPKRVAPPSPDATMAGGSDRSDLSISPPPTKKSKKAEKPEKSQPVKRKAVAKFEEFMQTTSADSVLKLSSTDGSGGFTHQVKLSGPAPFHFKDILTLKDLQLQKPEDNENIIFIRVQTAKAFNYMKLPAIARSKILEYVLATTEDSMTKDTIHVQSGTTGSKAKKYAEKMKNRVAILRTCKQLHSEGTRFLYHFHQFKFDDTDVLAKFLNRAGGPAIEHLRMVEIAKYKKGMADVALGTLGKCQRLTRLHISTGVASNATPSKAAKAFYTDAAVYFDNAANLSGNKYAGYDKLRFGKSVKCFAIKDGDETRAWQPEEKVEFHRVLKAQIK